LDLIRDEKGYPYNKRNFEKKNGTMELFFGNREEKLTFSMDQVNMQHATPLGALKNLALS